MAQQSVVIAGSGNIAQYLTEEFLKDGKYAVAIISRTDREFFHKPGVAFHVVKEYSKEAILPVLDGSNAVAIVSTVTGVDPAPYTSAHVGMLDACRASKTCKGIIPSEYLGNLRDFPQYPRPNYNTNQSFREILKQQSEIKWTLINQGWLADYFVQVADGSKSYIRPFPEGWPISLDRGTVRVVGSGDEPISWTSARDMAKAVVQLIPYQEWPDHTYVFGEFGTWNQAIEKVERFIGHELKRQHQSKEMVEADVAQTEDEDKQFTATIDEWSLAGACAVPQEEAHDQRERYFQNVHFRTIEELLEESKTVQII